MKPIFLLGWVWFALNLTTFAFTANAQTKAPISPKQTDTQISSGANGEMKDSLVKSMNALENQMKKLGEGINKNSAKFSEKYQASIVEQMEEMLAAMESIREELDAQQENLNVKLGSVNEEEDDLEARIESEVEKELEKVERNRVLAESEGNNKDGDNNNGENGSIKDSSKNKTVTIDDDGIHIRTGKGKKPKNVVKAPKNSETNWFLFDLGINTFTSNNTFDLPADAAQLELNQAKSINSTLHIFRTGVNIFRHKIYTTFGLTYDMHDYRFAQNTTLLADTNRFAYIESPYKLEKNKLSAQYLTLPVMLQFETKPMRPNQSFKIGVGGWAGFLVNSYTKQKSEERGKQHLHDNFSLNTLNYGVRGQIGYGMFTLYSQYSLSPLFKKNVGAPELNPITFGIVLNGFKWN